MSDEIQAPAPRRTGRPRKYAPGEEPKRIGPHSRKRVAELEAERARLAAEVDALKKGQASAVKAAAAAAREPERSEPPLSLVTLGPPPDDMMAAQSWAYRAVVLTLQEAMLDTGISAKERRKQIIQISGNLSKLMPDARRWETEKLIREDRAEIERKERAKRGAKLEPLPPRPRPAGATRP